MRQDWCSCLLPNILSFLRRHDHVIRTRLERVVHQTMIEMREGGRESGSPSDGGGGFGEGVRISVSDGDRCFDEGDRSSLPFDRGDRRDMERRIFSGVTIVYRLLSFRQWNRSNEVMSDRLKILIQMLLA
jgi:hypothetical protein